MTESLQPTSGSLSAKIIRACTKHNNKCGLDCPRRQVEDLGEIASFSVEPPAAGPGWVSRVYHQFFDKETNAS